MKLFFKCPTIIIYILICFLTTPVITFSEARGKIDPEENGELSEESTSPDKPRDHKRKRALLKESGSPDKSKSHKKKKKISKQPTSPDKPEDPEKNRELFKQLTSPDKPKDPEKKVELLKQSTSPDKPKDSERFVSIDFNNVDISVFIKFISELTGKNFIVDSKVKGKVTIISPTKISVNEAYKVFESVLEVQGFATVKAGEVIKIVSSQDARTKNIETKLKEDADSPEDKLVTQLIPLRYADPAEIKRLFAPMLSRHSVMLSYPPTNMLIVTDMYSNIKRLLGILKAIDVTGIGQEIAVIPLQYADATRFVKILESVFKASRTTTKTSTTQSPSVKFVADERTNTIITFASELDTERINKLVTLLDKEVPPGKEKIHVYYLENATAEELAKVLQAVPTKRSTSATKAKTTIPIISTDVKITADKATNSLIIMAEPNEYKALENIIKKLDIPRSMVYIECLLMEVKVSKGFTLGAEWVAGEEATYNDRTGVYGGGFNNMSGSLVNFSGVAASGTAVLPPGFSMGVFGEVIEIGTGGTTVKFPSLGAIINAYKSDSDVHILSTPQILTTDNEEAIIYVGQNVPFLTRQGTTTTESSYSNYEYKDVGITLKITPQISQDRLVRLKIEQVITKLAGDLTTTPVTLKRTIKTTVIVHDKSTVVIGGLIDDTLSNTEISVPCIGSIPLLGWLFKYVGRAEEKTNLYVFLTPHVVRSPEDAKKMYSEKRNKIDKVEEGRIKMYKE